MKKILSFFLILLMAGASLFAGHSWSTLAKPTDIIDQSGRNLGILGTLPDEILSLMIEQGLPQINTVQDLEKAWQFIASFSVANRHCRNLVNNFISKILASKINPNKVNELWNTLYDKPTVQKIKNNNKWFHIFSAFKAKLDIHQQDENGETTLHWLSRSGNKDAVELLLKLGADVNKQNKNGVTPLMLASNWGRLDVVSVLLQNGANVHQENNGGIIPKTALGMAAWAGEKEVVRLLLKYGAQVNTSNEPTPVYWAIEHSGVQENNGHLEVVKLLLHHGALVEINSDQTTLMSASMNGNKDIVALLLRHGSSSSVNKQDQFGTTALIFASKHGYKDVVKLLLQYGANALIEDNTHRDALAYCIEYCPKNTREEFQNQQEIISILYHARLAHRGPNNNNNNNVY